MIYVGLFFLKSLFHGMYSISWTIVSQMTAIYYFLKIIFRNKNMICGNGKLEEYNR